MGSEMCIRDSLMTQLRDEAHRFAITFHRQQRKKSTLRSALDDIPGIGAARRKALLKHFGSVTAIKEATREQLETAPGVPSRVAQTVWDWLHHPPPGNTGNSK